MVPGTKYDSHHTYEIIQQDSPSIRSECYAISFENQGDGNLSLILGGVPRTFIPGDNFVYNAGHPNVKINTIWDSVVFAPFLSDGITPVTSKKLFITREFLTENNKCWK